MALPVYSPTQTDAYAFCPRYWGFYKANLKPRAIEYPEIAAIVGTAVAKGLETFYRIRREGDPIDAIAIEQAALTYADRLREAALAKGLRFVAGKDQDDWDSIPDNIVRCLRLHAKRDPFSTCQIVDVESVIEDGSGSRADLIVRDDFGLLVVDFKCKLKLRSEWVAKEQMKWRRSWQMHHYTITRGAARFAVVLIAPHTREGLKYETVNVHQGYAALWYQDATILWREMTIQATMPFESLRGNTSHSNEYGECVYWSEACNHGLDRSMMNLVQVERVK